MPAPTTVNLPAEGTSGAGSWYSHYSWLHNLAAYVGGIIDSIQSTANSASSAASAAQTTANSAGTAAAAAQTTANAAVPTSTKGQANGVASLDGSGKVPTAQLPSSSGLALDTSTAPKKLAPVAAPGTSTSASPADHVHPRGWWTAADHGAVAWTYDPATVSGQANPNAAGTLQLVRLHVDQAATITNLVLYVAAAGTTLTSGQCMAALYSAAGALLGTTADQATAWQSTGTKTMALTTPYSAAVGDYYIGFWYQGTTAPQFLRQGNSSAVNLGLAAPNLRYATANTGLTTTAPSTLGTETAASNAWWTALT